MNSPRPVFLNLLEIRQPVTAVVSILHRLAGLILAVTTPLWIFLLARSLDGQAGYAAVVVSFDNAAMSLLLVAVLWAMAHHICAGLRLLILDICGHPVRGRLSAWLVLLLSAVSLVLAVLAVVL